MGIIMGVHSNSYKCLDYSVINIVTNDLLSFTGN